MTDIWAIFPENIFTKTLWYEWKSDGGVMTLPLMLGDRWILMVLYPRPLIIFPIFASNLASLNSCRGDLFWGSSEGLFWSIQDICIAYSGGSFEGLILSIQDVWMAYARIGVAKRQFKLHFSNNCNFQLDELKMESGNHYCHSWAPIFVIALSDSFCIVSDLSRLFNLAPHFIHIQIFQIYL